MTDSIFEFNKEQKEMLSKVVATARACSLEQVAISSDNEAIRGMNTKLGIVILHKIPKDFIPNIGITRVDVLAKRLEMMEKMSGFKIFYDLDESTNSVKSIIFKSGKTKTTFKCGAHNRINGPSSQKQKPSVSFSISKETLDVLAASSVAMLSKTATVDISENDVKITMDDVDANDTLEHIVTTDFIKLDGFTPMNHVYNAKTFLLVVKDTLNGGNIMLAPNGFVGSQYNGISIVMIPEIRR